MKFQSLSIVGSSLIAETESRFTLHGLLNRTIKATSRQLPGWYSPSVILAA
jgi:hypothetical protein